MAIYWYILQHEKATTFRFVFDHNIRVKEKNIFQSVTESVTQRKGKHCLKLPHKLIDLFLKMGISDWLLQHEKATTRILNQVK